MFVNESDLKEAMVKVATQELDVAKVRSHVPFELVNGVDDGFATKNGAFGMARVILAGLDDRRAMAEARETLRKLLTISDWDAICGAIEFERLSVRGTVREFEMASERFGLATGRAQDKADARRYNTVGAGRKLSADDTLTDSLAQGDIPYSALPRYTEEQARAVNVLRDEIKADTERERNAKADVDAHDRALAWALANG